MEKTYILDTSTIINDPNCLEQIPNSKIVIQISVLNELDKLKTFSSETGKNARMFVRLLDSLFESLDNVQNGIEIANKSVIHIDANHYNCSNLGDVTYGDNQILACALSIVNEQPTIITRDIGLRIKAKAFSINAIDYNKKSNKTDELHPGFVKIQNTEFGEKISNGKSIELKENYELSNLSPNECIYFTDNDDDRIISLARKNCKFVNPLQKQKPWNLNARNIEQAFAIDLLMDPKVPLVTLSGIAGTGKSLCALACGLEMVINKKQYENLIIYRPIQPVGNDIGFLPGTIEEKLDPWMAAINDGLDFLSNTKNKKRSHTDNWRNNLAPFTDKIHMEALTYIRGRSIPNAFILIDESQNISKEEIKTILTRVSHNTKIVFTGDIEQIDNSHLDAINNGLTYIIDNFKDSELSGHISLTKGERSPLATEAAKKL